MSLTRDEIIQFLELCIHRTITLRSDPTRFTIIANALYQHYRDIESKKFSIETLDRIEAFRITRSSKKKAIIVEVKYWFTSKFQAISWTNLYSKKEKTITPN